MQKCVQKYRIYEWNCVRWAVRFRIECRLETMPEFHIAKASYELHERPQNTIHPHKMGFCGAYLVLSLRLGPFPFDFLWFSCSLLFCRSLVAVYELQLGTAQHKWWWFILCVSVGSVVCEAMLVCRLPCFVVSFSPPSLLRSLCARVYVMDAYRMELLVQHVYETVCAFVFPIRSVGITLATSVGASVCVWVCKIARTNSKLTLLVRRRPCECVRACVRSLRLHLSFVRWHSEQFKSWAPTKSVSHSAFLNPVHWILKGIRMNINWCWRISNVQWLVLLSVAHSLTSVSLITLCDIKHRRSRCAKYTLAH